jgi:alpha-beta hydrolase superfamily lysophospholipase
VLQTDEFRYQAADGLRLFARMWVPAGDPQGIVVLVHGLGEYGGRYEEIGRRYTDRGYAFVAGDLRGHGLSEGRRAFASGIDVFMDDLDRYVVEVRSRFPGKPVFLYGFSMGSTLTAVYLIRRKPVLAGAVLCSGGFVMPAASAAAMSKVKLLRHLVPTLAVANGMGPVRDKVCHDVSVLDAYDADDLVYKKITVGLAAVIMEANQEALVHAGEIRVPLLVMHGSDDVIALPEGSQRLADGVTGDVTLKFWPGLYHFVHFEPGAKEQVAGYVADWMDAHCTVP